MQATIYIRKYNEERWNKLIKANATSRFVNNALELPEVYRAIIKANKEAREFLESLPPETKAELSKLYDDKEPDSLPVSELRINATKSNIPASSIPQSTPVLDPDVTIVSHSDVPQSKENFDKGNIFQLKAVKTSDPTKQAVCKIHGIALDFRGRCLQKGCKYA